MSHKHGSHENKPHKESKPHKEPKPYKHHHTPSYEPPSTTHHRRHAHGPGLFESLFGERHERTMERYDSASSMASFRRSERAEQERRAQLAAAQREDDRRRAEDQARVAQRGQADRIEALRGMHRVPLQQIVWETYRDQPDPGGADHARWEELRTLAGRVVARDELAFSEALTYCGCLVEAHTHVGRDGVRVSLAPTMGHIDLRAPLGDVIPSASGEHGALVRTMGDRLDIYQDYVCGLALRVARELLAVLPIELVTVDVWNVTAARPAQGEGAYRQAEVPATNVRIASMLCARAAMDVIPWGVADASLVVESLPHTMRFSPTEGFYEVPHVGAE